MGMALQICQSQRLEFIHREDNNLSLQKAMFIIRGMKAMCRWS